MTVSLVVRAHGRNDDAFWGSLEQILDASFDEDSLRPIREFRSACPLDPSTPLAEAPRFVGAYEGDRLVAIEVYEYLARSRTVYLWYVATTRDSRSRGIGAVLLDHLHADAAALVGPAGERARGILAEVEAPVVGEPASGDNRRRIAFYERHGYAVQPLEEVSPPFAPGAEEPVMYWVMVKPLGPALAEDEVMAALTDAVLHSALNGAPAEEDDEFLAYSLSTWGRPPREAEPMRDAWDRRDPSSTREGQSS